jgi:hypothetical protein
MDGEIAILKNELRLATVAVSYSTSRGLSSGIGSRILTTFKLQAPSFCRGACVFGLRAAT